MGKLETPANREIVNIVVALSLSRLLLLPAAIVGVASGNAMLAAGTVAAAVLTDLADGGLARILGQYSRFSKDFDSIVDFIFIHCLFIALFAVRRMGTWQFLAIYAAMLGTLVLQFMGAAKGQMGVVRTTLGRPVGAVEYAFLLILVGAMLVPANRFVMVVALWTSVVLATLAAVYLVECAMRLARRGLNAD